MFGLYSQDWRHLSGAHCLACRVVCIKAVAQCVVSCTGGVADDMDVSCEGGVPWSPPGRTYVDAALSGSVYEAESSTRANTARLF